ncbi:MAG: hypothetical protein ACPIOQ_13185, partial [Promethearchaeia archaeon]
VRVTCTSSVGEQGRGSTLAKLSIEIIRNDFKTSAPGVESGDGHRPLQTKTSTNITHQQQSVRNTP